MTQDSQITEASPLDLVNREMSEAQARRHAADAGLSYVDLRHFAIDFDALKLVTKEKADEAHILPFDLVGKKVRVAFFGKKSPLADEIISDLTSQGYEIEWVMCAMDGFEFALVQYDSPLLKTHAVEIQTETEETVEQELQAHLQDFSKIEEKLSTITAQELLNKIELLSVGAKASDIHLQPTKEGVAIRIRVDGVLHTVLNISKKIATEMILRIKYDAGMKANIKAVPQDGVIHIRVNDRDIELRTSTLPTPTIESVVMRILDASRGIMSFSELGFIEHNEKKITTALHRHNGIVLVTGPTGSGKTTTLYSMLSQLNDPERKLVTLEDPIEYHLDGVSQSQVDESQDYTFDTGFKSLLRHDPDVILVGEVRTLPTAKLAFEAALTGHTVLTSLHANSSVGAISRLRNLGVDNVNIAPTISAVFAQRLVRRVCKGCSKEVVIEKDNPEVLQAVERLQEIFPNQKIPEKVAEAQGCEMCSHTGYVGQIAVCEAFVVDDNIRKMILDGVFETDISTYLREKTDFLSLWEDGLLKVLSGDTTMSEIRRVVGEY